MEFAVMANIGITSKRTRGLDFSGLESMLLADPPIVVIPRDCLHCGVCCTSDSPTYVCVTGDDWNRLGEKAEQVAHFIGNRAYMKMNDGHCAALEVRLDALGAEEHFCTIYNRRPQTCRNLARGSPQCEAELLRKG